MASTVAGTKNNTDGKNVVSADYLRKKSGDCVSDAVLSEITRRLLLTLPDDAQDDIVRSEAPPQDKTKFWYRPSTKLLYAYNPETGVWETTNVDNFTICLSAASSDALTKDDEGCLLLNPVKLAGYSEQFEGTITMDSSGNGSKTVTLVKFEDEHAHVVVMPKESIPSGARWWISAQATTSVTITFTGFTASTAYQFHIGVIKS